jgi:hypothetical protein
MFKRLFWLIIGAGFGFGVSFWLMRFLRQTIERYSPERVSDDLSSALRSFGQDLRAAVAEGREAMRETEAQLRSRIEDPRPSANGKSGSGSSSDWLLG